MHLSVVTTLYHSTPYLREFHRRVVAAAKELTDDYEVIFVNDGSPDDALEVALAIHQEDPHVKVIDLSRNFGHHPAMMTGLRHAAGDEVFLIDCDLEEAPELLLALTQKKKETGADVVYGVQAVRGGNWMVRASGHLYYRFVNLLATDPLPENLLTLRLMSRRYVDALLQHSESEVNIAGLWVRTGFMQVPLPVEKTSKGTSTYTLSRKIAVLVNTITSMSPQPLVMIFYLGLIISGLAILAAFGIIIWRLFFSEMQMGWPSLIVSIWFLGGLMIFCQGVIGIYLSKVLLEAKRRPIAIVRAVYSHAAERPAITAAPAPGCECQDN
jgi:putative glycosyltransferase